jgi:enhancing lycopene biosynthesis protein 2
VSFAAITLCAASQRVFVAVVDFVIDSVRKLLDTPSYLLFSVTMPESGREKAECGPLQIRFNDT